MALVTRGDYITLTDTAQLRARFRDGDGQLADLDIFPTVTLVQPSGNVVVGPTSSGVYHLATGVYGFDYAIGLSGSNLGVWNDVWQGTLNGFSVIGEFNFVVTQGQVPAVNTDGYEKLGDDVPFCYSQCEIHNINKLLKGLRARLNSSGKIRTKDENGNIVYTDCDIFSVDTLVTLLGQALSMFNEIPTFTFFTFADSEIINQFYDVLVQGAVILALASHSAIERGLEYNITDNGISFTPPSVSELLNTQWSTELTNHTEKIKQIKASMRPAAIGLGTLSITAVRNPVISQLRHRRARQII
jgi:hypothetical protein